MLDLKQNLVGDQIRTIYLSDKLKFIEKFLLNRLT